MSEIRQVSTAPTETRRLTPGAEVDQHQHDEPQMIYASAGALEVTAADGTWFTAADPGDLDPGRHPAPVDRARPGHGAPGRHPAPDQGVE